MILVRALQRLIGNRLDEQAAGLSGFKTELNLAVENLAALARHNRAGTFSDDGGNYFAARFFNEIELAVRHACRAVVCPDPKRARIIGLQHEHATRGQTVRIDCVRAATVITRQSAICRKPSHTKFRLRDRVRSIRRQSMKRSHRAPLMQIRRWRRRRRRGWSRRWRRSWLRNFILRESRRQKAQGRKQKQSK